MDTPASASPKKILPYILSNAISAVSLDVPCAIRESVWRPASSSSCKNRLINAVKNSDFTRWRSLRSDKASHVQELLVYLIRHYDIASGVIVYKRFGYYRAVTVRDIVSETSMSERTVYRCLKTLVDVGYLETETQEIRRLFVNDSFIFSGVVRKLTDEFFRQLGLSKILFEERGKRRREYGQSRIIRPRVAKTAIHREKVGSHDKVAPAASQGPSRVSPEILLGKQVAPPSTPSNLQSALLSSPSLSPYLKQLLLQRRDE